MVWLWLRFWTAHTAPLDSVDCIMQRGLQGSSLAARSVSQGLQSQDPQVQGVGARASGIAGAGMAWRESPVASRWARVVRLEGLPGR